MENYVIEIKVVRGNKYTSIFRSLFVSSKCRQIHSNLTAKEIESRIKNLIDNNLLTK